MKAQGQRFGRVAAYLFAILSCCLTSNVRCRQIPNNQRQRSGAATPYIVGGDDVAPGEFPFVVRSAPGNNPNGICTATLIHEDICLTAAHCQGAFQYGVLIGALRDNPVAQLQLSPQQKVYFRQVDRQIRHAGFNQNPYFVQDDIMILRLDWPVGDDITPVRLNNDSHVPVDNALMTSVGFGLTDLKSQEPPNILQKADQLQYLNRSECENVLQFAGNVEPDEGIMW